MKYDDNSSRSKLDYYLAGTATGHKASVNYTYNNDNMLTDFNTSASGVTAPTFSFDACSLGDIDGLGRLTNAIETLTEPNNSTIAHSLILGYDSLSQLTSANISNIGPDSWTGDYNYQKNGDMDARTINSGTPDSFSYVGNEMRTIDGNSLDYDKNGNLTSNEAQDTSYAYNWDNKLRSATVGSDSISLKYDPAGNRVYKQSTVSGQTINRKYIVDVVGDLPVILLEIDPTNMSVKKGYIYANSQILAEHDGDYTANRYFYLHDRLGSVRQIINSSGSVVRLFTYNPFGETIEEEGSFYTPWQFTGQYLDSETGQYYLRARQYSPYLARFTSYDPIMGKFEDPITRHKYLYCGNNPVNMIDPEGLWALYVTATSAIQWGFARVAQFGFVIDDKGNVGTIAIKNTGIASPQWSTGVSIGYSYNARDIEDLAGYGYAAGGSYKWLGAEGFRGDNGVWGIEFTPAYSLLPIPEGHIYRTETAVRRTGKNWREMLDNFNQQMENSLFDIKTQGDFYRWSFMDMIFGEINAGRKPALRMD